MNFNSDIELLSKQEELHAQSWAFLTRRFSIYKRQTENQRQLDSTSLKYFNSHKTARLRSFLNMALKLRNSQ